MIYLINTLILPVVLAILLGILIGWSTVYREADTSRGSWLPTGFLIFALGCYAASVHLFAGRQGLYLEIALLMFGSYLIGCAVGYLLHRIAGIEPSSNGGLAFAGGPSGVIIPAAPAAVVAKPVQTGPDDLSLIWGVGDKLAKTLNGMGYYRFEQIAKWTEADVEKFESHSPEFRGRVARDEWIEQCRNLADGWRPSNSVGERHIKS
jgi:hypothetical protein